MQTQSTKLDKYDAVEQSHAISKVDEILALAGLPSYTNLLAVAEKATPVLLSKYMNTNRKTFAEIAEEYVSNMLAGERSEPGSGQFSNSVITGGE